MVEPLFCTIEHLSASVHKNFVLNIPNLDIPKNKFITILGENGAGKTTLLRAILGQIPKLGLIFFPGLGEIEKISAHDRAKIMSFLPAHDHCAFNFSIAEFLELGFPQGVYLGSEEKKQRIERVARELNIPYEALHKPIYSLSSGERKKIFLGRVMIGDADAFLLDEPYSYLDPFNTQELIEHLKKLVAGGKTILCVSHDLRAAYRHSDYVIGIKNGEVHGYGTAKNYLSPEVIKELFGIVAEIVVDHRGQNLLILNI